MIVASPTPAAYASSAFAFQNTATLGQGQEAWVAAANVVVSGNSGTTPLTSITFTTTGTTDLADLAGARVLYSGSNTSFNYQTTPEFGTPIVNPSGTLTFTGTQALTAGNNYFILVYAASSSVTANNLADATFESVTVDATVRTPSPTTLTGALRLIVPPSNDNLANAQKIYSTLLGVSQSTLGASLETDEVRNAGTCAASDGTGSIWYSYTPGTTGPATFDLSASTNAGSTTPGSFDTVLSVWTGSAHPLTSLGCDDDAGADVTSLLTVDVTGGTTYYVRITGYGASIGTAVMNITGPAPVQTFTSVAPAAGAVIRTGVETVLRWTNPTLAPRDVRVLVRRGTGPFSSIFVGRNRGYLRYTFPTGTAPNVDYQYLVIDAGDASSFGTSPLFTVTDPAQAFVFTSPAPGTKWARGTTRTVTWTIPAGAVGGDVLFETFYKRRVLGLPTETELVSSFTTANDGTETIVIPAMAELGTYVYKVTKIGNAAFFGAGGVRIVITEVTAPVAGQTVNAGDPLTVTWIAASADPAAFVRIRLRSATQPTVVISPPAGLTNTGTASVTIPAGTVSGSDYFVQVQVQVAGVFANGSSKTFTIVGAGPRPVASTEHFVAPVGAGTAMAELVVSTPGLADGAEVAAFSGHLLVGSARVAGGMATMTVRGTVADMAFVAEGLTVEEALTTMEDGTVLSLRTWSATAGETVLEAGRVSDADGNEVDALTFVDGQDLTVAAKGAGTEGATAFALAGVSPNPMSSAGTVRFTMPDAQAVSVVVYDLLGRRVTTLFEGMAQAGANEVAVAARSLNAGVYVVRVSGTGVSATQRFTVVR